MRILLHICCAPCSIGPFEELTGQGHEVTGYFHNPNIHPFVEFRRRIKAVKVLQERMPIPVIFDEQYGLEEHLERVNWRSPERCAHCYRLRLAEVARKAKERGFDAMTTALLESIHQDHELIRSIGEQSARAADVEFFYADWRPLAEESHRRAKEMRLYLQNYCGCIFSEWERFRNTTLHVYRGPGPASAANERQS